MIGSFMMSSETLPEVLDWGKLRWMSSPPATGAKDLTVIEVNIIPGEGHDFHKHPDQEEVIYVISGQVEQWLDREKRILGRATLYSSAQTSYTPASTSATRMRNCWQSLDLALARRGMKLLMSLAKVRGKTCVESY